MVCWCRAILSLLILVLAFFWDKGVWVQWVVVLAALLIFLLTMFDFCCCKSCAPAAPKPLPKPVKKVAKKKR